MNRFVVTIEGAVFAQWVWAENKAQARKQIMPYVRSMGGKITSIEKV